MGSTVERHTHVDLEEGVACLIGERKAIANVTYAKVMGAVFLVLGIFGMFYTGDTLLGIGMSSMYSSLHILAGVLWVGAVMTFDGTYARMINQVVGIMFIALGAFGLSESVPQIHALFNLNSMSTIFNLIFGFVTAGIGWGVNTSHLKHWWP